MTTFTGTADDDSFTGTSDGDDFHLEQGGHDTAFGGAGIDVFYMGAAFDRIDQIDGGSDEDYLLLSGDYRKGVAFTATTMTAIEVVQLDPGFKYRLTGLTDANVGAALTIDGGGLGHKEKMTIDASGVVDGALVVIGGAGKNLITTGGGDDTISALDGANRINAGRGDDSVSVLDGDNSISGAGGDDIITVGDGDNTIDGGNGADRITFGAGANHVTSGAGDDSFYGPVTAGDILDAGTGVDTLFSQGAAVPLGAENAAGFERIVYGGDAVLVLEDSFNSGGLTVRSADETVGSLQFDGSQETDARFDVDGTHQADVITGGALGDHLAGGAGADLISGETATTSSSEARRRTHCTAATATTS